MKHGSTLSRVGWLTLACFALTAGSAPAAAPGLEAYLGYPFETGLTSASHGDAIAWVRMARGVRNVWVAKGPDFTPRQITQNQEDDGQELTQLTFSPDGTHLVWVRGGDHDANWPAEGGLAPDPRADTEQPLVAIWGSDLSGAPPVKIAEGDAPALSATGALAFIKDHQVWTASLDGKGKAERLFFDRGKDAELTWSPSGDRLAFVSNRGDHAFIGVYGGKTAPLTYIAPSTGQDASPRWSPDGRRIAFTRQPGEGGPPDSFLKDVPHPWSIWVAGADGSSAQAVWRSAGTIAASFPEVAGEANLLWAAGDRLVFLSEADNWQHLYWVPAAGGAATLLTPGDFMVEHVALGPGGASVVFDANTGASADDGERRHLFSVSLDGGAPKVLTRGETIDVTPVAGGANAVAYIAAGARTPQTVSLLTMGAAAPRALAPEAAKAYPAQALVTPRPVTFKAADGLTIHGDLFETAPASGQAPRKPAMIFVHGGPPRQMLLGWHYMDYYTHAYAMNQYLAAHGYVVLSVNYRLGIGYGRAFNHAEHSGPRGAAEYLDVVAGGRFLQTLPEVDPGRIGIWGGSYGGYLTAMALAKNSDIFKVGVDLHGVHDWSATLGRELPPPPAGFEKGDRDAAMALAFKSSPVADLSGWTSPVLLIQGDDDRNVGFHETIDLARRLDAVGAPYEELVLPNEIHGFLRYRSWLTADKATINFLGRHLGVAAADQ